MDMFSLIVDIFALFNRTRFTFEHALSIFYNILQSMTLKSQILSDLLLKLQQHKLYCCNLQTLMPIIILLIMKNLLRSQYQKQSSKASTLNLRKEMLNHNKLVTTHLIDGIYQGFVNSSYQRDGFGLIQTQNYQTYLGFFKYNKIHGLGIIIYPDGSILYGNFIQGKLQGIALSDNFREMQIGTYKHEGMVGIGFQFNYQEMKWRMSKYHKYVPIDTISEEIIKNPGEIPQMFSVEPLILQHYLRYKTKQFFYNENQYQSNLLFSSNQDVNSVYYHQLSQNTHFFGAMIQDKYQGLGVVYDSKYKHILQAGMYSNGLLDGFGLKNQSNNTVQFVGKFVKGKKEGLFIHKNADRVKFSVYSNDQKYNEQQRQQNDSTFQKYYRISNYRQKDFLSIRHGIEFLQLKSVFQTKDYKVWKLQLMNDNNKKQKQTPGKNKEPKEKVRTPPANSHSLINVHAFQKSSLFIMKEKISSFTSKKKGYSTNKQEKKLNNLKIIQTDQPKKKDSKSGFEDYQQDEIGVQENPLQQEPNQSYRKKSSFKRK